MNQLRTKRILIISNNALSQTNNNGKTIESIFSEYSSNHLSQLFFRLELPNSKVCKEFYRITEQDMVKKVLRKQNESGNIIVNSNENIINNSSMSDSSGLKKTATTRLLREIFWKMNLWKDESLSNWLDKIKPEVIFFCAGDSIFAYSIVNYIISKFGCKLVMYITDDYILRKQFPSYLDKFRLKILYNRMVPCIKNADLLITISDKMKITYLQCFGKDSIVVRNMTKSLKTYSTHIEKSNSLRLIYAGSLYYGRDIVLLNLAIAIELINEKQNTNHQLNIFTNAKIDKKILNQFNSIKCVNYGGSLSFSELKGELNNSDIPVFVESFSECFVEKTRYSFSTKIPEYISLGKCILAIGPEDIGSMEFLKDVAFCINQPNEINDRVAQLCFNEDLRRELGNSCIKSFDHYISEIDLTKILNKIVTC